MITYWLVGGFFLVLDLTGWLSKYKVQPGTNQPPTTPKLTSLFKMVLFNQLAVGVPLALLSFEVGKWLNKGEMDPELLRRVPTLGRLLYELAVHSTFREILFFYSHW